MTPFADGQVVTLDSLVAYVWEWDGLRAYRAMGEFLWKLADRSRSTSDAVLLITDIPGDLVLVAVRRLMETHAVRITDRAVQGRKSSECRIVKDVVVLRQVATDLRRERAHAVLVSKPK